MTRNGYQYRCIVTDARGNTATTKTALLTITEVGLEITADPQDQTVEEGGTAHFIVAAKGKGLTYQWQYKPEGKTRWYNSSSATAGYNTAELQVVGTMIRNGYQYRCVVSDGSGNSETSVAATLTVTAPGPTITQDPQNQSVAAGETAHFAVAATGEGLTYQWQYRIAGQTSWRNCTESTTGYRSAELEVVGTAKRNGYQYRCVVSDENGETATSAAATLTVE